MTIIDTSFDSSARYRFHGISMTAEVYGGELWETRATGLDLSDDWTAFSDHIEAQWVFRRTDSPTAKPGSQEHREQATRHALFLVCCDFFAAGILRLEDGKFVPGENYDARGPFCPVIATTEQLHAVLDDFLDSNDDEVVTFIIEELL